MTREVCRKCGAESAGVQPPRGAWLRCRACDARLAYVDADCVTWVPRAGSELDEVRADTRALLEEAGLPDAPPDVVDAMVAEAASDAFGQVGAMMARIAALKEPEG